MDTLQPTLVRLNALQRALQTLLVRRTGILRGFDAVVFDASEVTRHFEEYAQLATRLKHAAPEVFGEIPLRPAAKPAPSKAFNGRAEIPRHDLEQLLRDIDVVLEIAARQQAPAPRAETHDAAAEPRPLDPAPSVGRRVFIGHGGSDQWYRLALFLSDLSIEYDEFNRESAAGVPTVERLNQMLQASCFAFLIMTAEDEHSDGSRHARENVVHEVGLFQGRHGFRRAIVLIEEGCAAFSNISGLGQIRFPRGDILAKTEEIRRVLQREGVL